MKLRKLLVIFFVTIFFIYLSSEQDLEPIENLNIEIGAGFDVIKNKSEDVIYKITRAVYIFKWNQEVSSKSIESYGITMGKTRQDAGRKVSKREVRGQEHAILISENQAMYGISNLIDIVFKNPGVNDNAVIAVCKGETAPYMELKNVQYPSALNYIQDLVMRLKEFNFYSKENDILNLYIRVGAEGRSVVLPYLEIKNNDIEATGTAVFKDDKLSTILNMEDTRTMNILRENRGKGILSLKDTSKNYLDFYVTKSKRKVKCIKEGEKYSFMINLDLTGSLITNQLYKLSLNLSNKNKIEEALAENVKKSADNFIEKMKNEIKVDCLELGREAAAKYGRRKVEDWDKVISDSNIKVKVTVHINNYGRGEF